MSGLITSEESRIALSYTMPYHVTYGDAQSEMNESVYFDDSIDISSIDKQRSNLKSSNMNSSSGTLKRRVTFNDSIESNDGHTWAMEKVSPIFSTGSEDNNSPSYVDKFQKITMETNTLEKNKTPVMSNIATPTPSYLNTYRPDHYTSKMYEKLPEHQTLIVYPRKDDFAYPFIDSKQKYSSSESSESISIFKDSLEIEKPLQNEVEPKICQKNSLDITVNKALDVVTHTSTATFASSPTPSPISPRSGFVNRPQYIKYLQANQDKNESQSNAPENTMINTKEKDIFKVSTVSNSETKALAIVPYTEANTTNLAVNAITDVNSALSNNIEESVLAVTNHMSTCENAIFDTQSHYESPMKIGTQRSTNKTSSKNTSTWKNKSAGNIVVFTGLKSDQITDSAAINESEKIVLSEPNVVKTKQKSVQIRMHSSPSFGYPCKTNFSTKQNNYCPRPPPKRKFNLKTTAQSKRPSSAPKQIVGSKWNTGYNQQHNLAKQNTKTGIPLRSNSARPATKTSKPAKNESKIVERAPRFQTLFQSPTSPGIVCDDNHDDIDQLWTNVKDVLNLSQSNVAYEQELSGQRFTQNRPIKQNLNRPKGSKKTHQNNRVKTSSGIGRPSNPNQAFYSDTLYSHPSQPIPSNNYQYSLLPNRTNFQPKLVIDPNPPISYKTPTLWNGSRYNSSLSAEECKVMESLERIDEKLKAHYGLPR